ncbi:unknown [Prevotella sp. CAG:1185]|nr:unknown [Prevotella sp. CAG:1185]
MAHKKSRAPGVIRTGPARLNADKNAVPDNRLLTLHIKKTSATEPAVSESAFSTVFTRIYLIHTCIHRAVAPTFLQVPHSPECNTL